jgi:hypothetical protein
LGFVRWVVPKTGGASPYVYGDFAREIGRWALFMGGPWPPKQGRGLVAINPRHARPIRGKRVP